MSGDNDFQIISNSLRTELESDAEVKRINAIWQGLLYLPGGIRDLKIAQAMIQEQFGKDEGMALYDRIKLLHHKEFEIERKQQETVRKRKLTEVIQRIISSIKRKGTYDMNKEFMREYYQNAHEDAVGDAVRGNADYAENLHNFIEKQDKFIEHLGGMESNLYREFSELKDLMLIRSSIIAEESYLMGAEDWNRALMPN